MPGWDYSREALYFLTIVTQNRVCNLGDINDDDQMILSDFGKIVNDEWVQSFEIRKELELHEYVIMPNHLHTIVEIKKPEIESDRGVDTDGQKRNPIDIVDRRGVGIVNTDGRPYQRDIKRNMPVRKPKSISSFMAGFKSAVNTKIDDYIDDNNLDIPKYNRDNPFFQRDYHDRIIRDEAEYLRIKYYIINNPNNWKGDRLNQ